MKIMNALVLGVLGTGLSSGCHVAHKAAVTSFRVIDAPAAYVRRQIDAENQTQTTTTTSTTVTNPESDVSAPGYPVIDAAASQSSVRPREPAATQHRQTTDTTAAGSPPRSTSREAVNQSVETRPKASASSSAHPPPAPQTAQLPYAKPVPGKPGYVFSPFDPNSGYVDVTGYTPGSKVKDPYSGKIFLVP